VKILSLYPKNATHFKKLIPLTKKVISICKKNKIKPVIYGSFAHFYHTKDAKIKINDIDILIQEKYISKLAKELKKQKIKFSFYPPGIIVKKGRIKLEIDKMDKEYNTKNHFFFKNVKKIDFYGIKTNVLSIKQLEDIYEAAFLRTKEDKIKIGKKIDHLEKFLGRKLK